MRILFVYLFWDKKPAQLIQQRAVFKIHKSQEDLTHCHTQEPANITGSHRANVKEALSELSGNF